MWKIVGASKVSVLYKYCVDVENCGSFKSFGYIYIYIYIYIDEHSLG